MRHGNDEQPGVAPRGALQFFRHGKARIIANGILAVAVCAFVAACASAPKKSRSSKRSKEYFSEKKYGVSASPRVAKKGKPVRTGGGRYLVGRPYKVAGKWYRPRAVKSYNKTGSASWYGAAFHGRLTANGEVYDMNRLSAAHTTLPLPSYVRVTNVRNKRSVIVRVNDRGPFHGRRVIDLSKRTAELLDFKHRGVAKVRVTYIGRAPLHGRDHAKLMASYRGPGQTAPGGTLPGTMIASTGGKERVPTVAGPQPPVLIAKAPIPVARPYWAANPPTQVAFDPAAAFDNSSVMVAAADAAPISETPAVSQPSSGLTSTTGTYSPAADPTATRVRTISLKAPSSDTDTTVIAAAQPAKTPATAPSQVQMQPAPARVAGPIPRAAIGSRQPAPTEATGGPFVALPVTYDAGTNPSVSAGGLFYRTPDRISEGHAVIAAMANRSNTQMTALSARVRAYQEKTAQNTTRIQIGVFKNADSVTRLEARLGQLGRVDRKTVMVKGTPMTLLSLANLRHGVSADDAIAAAERLGARGAIAIK